MKRWMKKGVATVLACAMLLGNYGIGHAAGSRAGDGAGGNTTSLLTDAVYDEALAFNNNVVFLENGHWPTEEYHEERNDEGRWEYVVDKRETNVTAETRIVFMDAKGNKKEISNKDSKGEQMFDAVFPSVSSTWGYQMLRVLKDDKVSYIRQDGTFFGGELTYYKNAEVISNDFILVSDDGVTYRALNSKGEVTADNLKVTDFNGGKLSVGYTTDYSKLAVIVLYCDDKTVVFDAKGNSIKEYDKNVSISPLYSGGYIQLKDDTKTQLIDSKGTVLKEFDPNVTLWPTYIRQGYVAARKTETVETERQETTRLVNLETGEVVFTGYQFGYYSGGIMSFDGEIIVGRNQDNTISVLNTDGTVYIADLDQFVKELGTKEGYQSAYFSSPKIVNDSLLLSSSVIEEGMSSSERYTFVLTKENGFAADGVKILKGGDGKVSDDGKYILTLNNNGYIQNLYTIDGELIQTFEENAMYGYSLYSISGQRGSDKLIFYSYLSGGYGYITENGKISSETFKSLRKNGNFLIVKKDDSVEAWNSSGKLVYINEEAADSEGYFTITVSDFSNYGYDCFSVEDRASGEAYLYNREGDIIFGADEAYSAIGTAGSSDNGYWGSPWYYWYDNHPLSNGLCIIEKTEGDTTKYGAIVLNGKKAEGYISIGDVDGDGEITADDALNILKSKAGLLVLDDNAKKAADVDGDGAVTSDDALDILKKKAGLLDIFKAEA